MCLPSVSAVSAAWLPNLLLLWSVRLWAAVMSEWNHWRVKLLLFTCFGKLHRVLCVPRIRRFISPQGFKCLEVKEGTHLSKNQTYLNLGKCVYRQNTTGLSLEKANKSALIAFRRTHMEPYWESKVKAVFYIHRLHIYTEIIYNIVIFLH